MIIARDIQIRQQMLNLEIYKKAFELVKEYKFDIEKLEDTLIPYSFIMENGIIKRRVLS
jgi:hypothetical protein